MSDKNKERPNAPKDYNPPPPPTKDVRTQVTPVKPGGKSSGGSKGYVLHIKTPPIMSDK